MRLVGHVSPRCPNAALARSWRIHGVDFTSAPRRAKPITIATGRFADGQFELVALHGLGTLAEYETWLAQPGPWVAGFDFPFGLPREALRELGWPASWPQLARHCTALGRTRMRAALDHHRAGRSAGDKYCYRRGDAAAGAHSPLKLVNPPVALMFLEGACRLYHAGVTIPGMYAGDPGRIALEAYPGYAVRTLFGARTRISYKNDAKGKQTPAHRRVRATIVRTIVGAGLNGVRLRAGADVLRQLRLDATGDWLDAVLCALQAAWAWQRCHDNYGLPPDIDPIEGWIVTVPGGTQSRTARPAEQCN